jgi:hypothetical protein
MNYFPAHAAQKKYTGNEQNQLDVQKHVKMEDGLENAAKITNKSLTRTGGVD